MLAALSLSMALAPASGDADNIFADDFESGDTSAWKTRPPTFLLTVSPLPPAGGSVTSDVGGIDCGGTCVAELPANATVNLSATANTGHRFAGWSGGGCGETSPCQITMDQDFLVTATFVPRVTITAAAGTGGTVSAGSLSPAADCTGVACTVDAGAGTVTLTATPNAGFRFGAWSGATCTGGTGAGNQLTFTNPVSDHTCTATFIARVTVSGIAGAGGSVAASSTSANALCSSTSCSIDSGNGTVSLTATPNPTFVLVNWSGTGCSSTANPLSIVNPVADRSCTANFVKMVTVTGIAGPGGSVIASAFSGTCIGATCVVPVFTLVTLHANPDPGHTFLGWSGGAACIPELNPLGITATSDTACTASFS